MVRDGIDAISAATRVVVITGAAGGIGRELVDGFAADGYAVVAVDLASTPVLDLEAAGAAAAAYACDVSREADIGDMFARIMSRMGRIDALVNNAALGPTMAATVDTTLQSFKEALGVNLIGPFVLTREAAACMKRGGAIVNIASLAGVLGNPRRNAYAASKAGLISLTKSLACEWAERGIRVSAVAPGYVRTPMVAQLEQSGKVDLSAVRRRIPMGRLARPDEIASVARFLASDSARYVTGAVFAVDGGWMSFNQPGDAHPAVAGTPEAELTKPSPAAGPRVVLVTGAAMGLGEAMARRFRDQGDIVVAADREGERVAALGREFGEPHLALEVDVASESSVRALFEAVRKRFGRLDVLVNNAAIADAFAPGSEQRATDLEKVLDVNLCGAFLCAREAVRMMTPGGVIVNLGSINTFLPFAPRHAYGASKAGIDILTRCLAAELGPSGLRTVTIAPGYIRTPGVATLERTGRIDSEAIRRRVPMGDLGRPGDVAEAAAFLTSSAASYVNGSILYVDGGWTSFGNAGFASQWGGATPTD
jgi:NAD(P)-dependent dehydrogenase (short-subunit alcohol dehydrogenase family)